MTKEHREKHSPVRQPIDRHLSEVAETDRSTTYINAGIDSTCCKKQTGTIHRLNDNGIVGDSSSSLSTSETASGTTQ